MLLSYVRNLLIIIEMDGRIYMLVHKELTGELSPSEATELHQLRNQAGAPQLSDDISLIWNVSKDYFPRQDWNTGSAKAQFLNKIRADKPVSVIDTPAAPIVATSSNWWKWALGAVIIAGLSYVLYSTVISNTNTAANKTLEANENIEFAILDDDTKVWLGEGSSLKSIVVDGSTRSVKLEGEAFFDVSHDPNRVFKIDLGDGVKLEVLGTSFKAMSANSEGTGKVSVREGVVRLYSTVGKKINVRVEAGQTGILNVNEELFNTENTAETLSLGNVESLGLRNLPLKDAFPKLASHYGVEINIGEANLGDCRFSSAVSGEPSATEIFQAITEIHSDLNIEAVDRSAYRVTGKCQ